MLKVVLNGESRLIDFELFTEFAQTVREILDDAGRLERRRAVTFRIGGLHASSPTIMLEPVAEVDDEGVVGLVVDRVTRDLARLEEAGTIPDWMSIPTVERLHRAAAKFGDTPVDGFTVGDEARPARLTRETYRHLDRLLHTTTDAIGSVTGVLMTATLINGPHLTVRDDKHQVNVRCNIDREALREAAREIGRRIRVSGRIRRGLGGRPERITATAFDVVQDVEPPTVREVVGLLEGGPDSVTWLRQQRD